MSSTAQTSIQSGHTDGAVALTCADPTSASAGTRRAFSSQVAGRCWSRSGTRTMLGIGRVAVHERAELAQLLGVGERRLPLALVGVDDVRHLGFELGADPERIVDDDAAQVVDAAFEVVEPARPCAAGGRRCARRTSGSGRCTGSASRRRDRSRTARACCGFMPPLPHRYRFQPFSVAMMPKSLPCASAHSRAQPETARLELVRRAQALVAVLDPHRHADRVLHAVAAPGAADARLHGAQRLAVGVPRFEAGRDQLAPDRRAAARRARRTCRCAARR